MLGINIINDLHVSAQESPVAADEVLFVQNAWDHKVFGIVSRFGIFAYT